MIGILFLVVGVLFGYALWENLYPDFWKIGERTFDGKKISMVSYYIRVPAWVLGGLLPLTWVTYLSAYGLKVFCGVVYPLAGANAISMTLFAALAALLLWIRHKRHGDEAKEVSYESKRLICELILFAALLVLFTELMFNTFCVKDGQLFVGYTVHSDFAPHMGMIRSFSYSNNFPTQYVHFAGEDVKYHFMFQFLTGNLEFLGMRIDVAFNLLSIFGLMATCTLLYAFAVKLSGKRLVGALTVLFFVFRSSPSLFRFLAEVPKEELTLQFLKEYSSFFEYTDKENWGLWNIKVYCNQRHLAFALAMMLLALHFFMPYVYEMAGKLKERKENYCKTFFFTKTAFGVKHPVRALVLGILLGALSFFNGSVVIACCAMLFFMAAVSDYRLDYLITALTALILSVLESKLFITGSAVSAQYFFGFLAENETLLGVLDYMWRLWGVLLIFIGAYLLFGKGVKRYLVFVFAVPLVIAFTVFLISGIEVTPDNHYLVKYYVSVNHKFVMMSEMLLSVFPAIIIAGLCDKRNRWFGQGVVLRRIVAVFLVVLLTATGVFEYHVVRNQDRGAYQYYLQDPVTVWINENTDADDLILSGSYDLNPVVLGGGMLYYGHGYYAGSAGYDTAVRERAVREMYGARSREELDSLIKENEIDYIIVDIEAREEYNVREHIIAATYEAVYTQGEDDWKLTIYDTSKSLLVSQ